MDEQSEVVGHASAGESEYGGAGESEDRGSEVGGGDQCSQLYASREIDRGGKDRERDWGERRRSVAAANVEGEHEIGGRESRLSARRWKGGAVSTCAMALHPRLAPVGEFGAGGERGGPEGREASMASVQRVGEQGRRASQTPDREGIATTVDGSDESATTRDQNGGRTVHRVGVDAYDPLLRSSRDCISVLRS
ncbi:hypothetical protein ZEAMMB73_Zm00001d049283 [Zea mays]|jgi:hypothetical protein|uniref:Uncharacterized protein n=1 Tax=Zea mays TaxID=4577 RepID=A0A1D6PTM5_MAIZE|nr:hypothetical protein ZEAMMB73_Zm00001d049283 [Zea mays]